MKIYFLDIQNYADIPEKMRTHSLCVRGYQLFNSLKKIYNNTYLINYKELKELIKKSNERIVIYILKSTNYSKDILQSNNNIVIWDVIDKFNRSINYINLSNIILAPNKLCGIKIKNVLNYIKKTNVKTYLLYHNWDDRMRHLEKNNNKETLQIAFSGTLNDEEKHILKNVPGIKNNSFLALKDPYKEQTLLAEIDVYLCFRNKDLSLLKPSTKVSACSSFHAIYAGTRDGCPEELLGHDYPYFLNGPINVENVNNLLNYIKKTRNTSVWNMAIDRMKKVYINTDVDNIAKQLLQIISQEYIYDV